MNVILQSNPMPLTSYWETPAGFLPVLGQLPQMPATRDGTESTGHTLGRYTTTDFEELVTRVYFSVFF